jgi:hypothetical protein
MADVTNIVFQISKEAAKNFDWGDTEVLSAIQSGDTSELSPRDFRLFVARFMVDANNQIVPHAQAVRILRKVNNEQIQAVIEKFRDAIQQVAVPNVKGSLSKSPSEADSAAPSPDGSTQ